MTLEELAARAGRPVPFSRRRRIRVTGRRLARPTEAHKARTGERPHHWLRSTPDPGRKLMVSLSQLCGLGAVEVWPSPDGRCCGGKNEDNA